MISEFVETFFSVRITYAQVYVKSLLSGPITQFSFQELIFDAFAFDILMNSVKTKCKIFFPCIAGMVVMVQSELLRVLLAADSGRITHGSVGS